ncbi:MAG: YqiJ family protein [Gammaproteobacteria bacterium]|nr:YqiJ family protein [Gammaproteobacteria bacterium]
MFEFLTADQNVPFSVALALVTSLALLEGVGMLLGAGISNILDALLPDALVPDMDTDMPDTGTPGPLSGLLGWLHVGKVPMLVILILLLLSFGLGGLLMQSLAQRLSDELLPAWIACGAALIIALPLTRAGGRLVARLIPRDETEAVSGSSFVGRVAVLTLGSARAGYAAQARLTDKHGQAHYLMVEPEGATELAAESEVLIVKKQGHKYLAIPNPNPLLSD